MAVSIGISFIHYFNERIIPVSNFRIVIKANLRPFVEITKKSG